MGLRAMIFAAAAAVGSQSGALPAQARSAEVAVLCRSADAVAADLGAILCAAFAEHLAKRFPEMTFHLVNRPITAPEPAPWVALDLLSAGPRGAEMRISWHVPPAEPVVFPDQGIQVSDTSANAARLTAFLHRAIDRSGLPFR